jgi:hypothetical protein
MKSTAKPIRSTIIWGLIGGLLYIPLYVAGRIRGLAVTLEPRVP